LGRITIPYKPRPQQRQIHTNLNRFNVLVCHRRFGKTILAINELVKGAVKAKKAGLSRPRFFYIAPLYKQAKQVAWDYLQHYTECFPDAKNNQAELRVDFLGGCRVQLLGADSPDSIRGVYADGVVLDEYAQMAPSLWSEVIRPALSDRKGWAIFIGTPKGKNIFYDLYTKDMGKDWYKIKFKASETDIVDADELTSARMTMTQDEYNQEYECSFSAAIRGAFYSKDISDLESKDRIREIPVDPYTPVHTAWDLGMSDQTTIWFFQTVGSGEIRIIDYYENNSEGLSHYAKVLRDKDYFYGTHIAPHDIQVRELGTGKSRKEVASTLGIQFTVCKNVLVNDGIQAVRTILPRCWFNDIESVHYGLEALRQYKRDYNEKLSVFSQRPLHDWSSHAADSFRYLALMVDSIQVNAGVTAQAASDMYEQYARPVMR